MNIQLIRNATLVVQYAGKKFLIDPMLAEKGTLPAFGPEVGLPDAPRQDQKNPLVSRSEEHTSELQSRGHLVCRLLLEKKKKIEHKQTYFKSQHITLTNNRE